MKKSSSHITRLLFLILFTARLCITSRTATESDEISDSNRVRFKARVFESPIQEILWCGASAVISETGDMIEFERESKLTERILFLLTESGDLHLSRDYGFTFDQLNNRMQEQISFPTRSRTNNSTSTNPQIVIRDIMLSPVRNTRVFIFSETGLSYRTDDCGATFEAMSHDASLHGIDAHPKDANALLGLIPQSCQPSETECNENTSLLVVSLDSGSTWKPISTNVTQALWDQSKSPSPASQVFNKHQSENEKEEEAEDEIENSILHRIVFAHFIHQEGGYVQKRVSYTDDIGTSIILVEKYGVLFHWSADYFFVLIEELAYGRYKLLIGPAILELSAARQEIDLQIKHRNDQSFTVINVDDDGTIMVSIDHTSFDQSITQSGVGHYTNLYISNTQGKKFSLSLQFAASDLESNIDVESIESSAGTFITNAYTSSTIKRHAQIQSKRQDAYQANQPHGKGTQSHSVVADALSRLKDTFELVKYKKTRISFDKGGTWHDLLAPQFDVDGIPYSCSGECSLHLKGRTDVTSNGTPVISAESAPGIILGTGNVGMYLEKDASDLRTYISIDGGHAWKEIRKGVYRYEIADQGGIIVMAKDTKDNDEVIYSLDEGTSWNSLKLPINYSFSTVDAFMTEHANHERQLLLIGQQHGLEESKIFGRGVIVALDFSTVFQRECTGFDTPGGEGSDYERWFPVTNSNQNGNATCILGSRISYVRKVKHAACFNRKENTAVRKELTPCACTAEDFECDTGFVRDSLDEKKCLPLNNKFAEKNERNNLKNKPENCKDFYQVTQGYRKIAGNRCVGGQEDKFAPKKIACNNSEQDKSENGSRGGLFNRSKEEIDAEIASEYSKQTQDSRSSFGLDSIFGISDSAENIAVEIGISATSICILLICYRRSKNRRNHSQKNSSSNNNSSSSSNQNKLSLAQVKQKGDSDAAIFKQDEEDDDEDQSLAELNKEIEPILVNSNVEAREFAFHLQVEKQPTYASNNHKEHTLALADDYDDGDNFFSGSII